MKALAWIAVLALAGCAGAGDDATDEIEIDIDGKADAELRVRVDGLTVWIDPGVTRSTGARPWRLHGRTSRNLAHALAFIPDDAFGEIAVSSPRTFDISLDDRELDTLASGLPLFVSLSPTDGTSATAAIWLAPRVGDFTGTWRLRIDTTVTPRWIGGGVVYRGGARSEPGWFLSAESASAPQVFAEANDRYRLDWSASTFLAGAHTPFSFHVQRAADVADKQARPQFAVRRLGVTRGDAYDVWPRTCGATVRACSDALPAGSIDASSCGTYLQVADCGGLTVATMPELGRVVADFRAHLVGYYTDHADIPSDGGNTLAQAQAAVQPDQLVHVTVPEEDPYAHDLSRYWVFRHPDVAFPGSDTAWFIVYDKASGALTEVYDFN
ncbi:MAG: hypothetical protein SFX73_12695 [Kofleriaceae bacterium]|nr:hypothetical protein [Kofleriaceae bacterium]